MADPRQVEGIPEPLDGDDDDVAWALQTAAVEWRRAAYGDAITWLRRASSAAMEAGHAPRAAFLEAAAARLATSSGPARPGEGRPQGSATEVVVEVDDDDGLETIEGLDALGEAGAEGRGRVPGLPRCLFPRRPSPRCRVSPGGCLRSRPRRLDRYPPWRPASWPRPPGDSCATPGVLRRPAGRGSVLRSIAHPEERERQHEVLPPQPGGHDSAPVSRRPTKRARISQECLGWGRLPGGEPCPPPPARVMRAGAWSGPRRPVRLRKYRQRGGPNDPGAARLSARPGRFRWNPFVRDPGRGPCLGSPAAARLRPTAAQARGTARRGCTGRPPRRGPRTRRVPPFPG
jgi:hypothetical protein